VWIVASLAALGIVLSLFFFPGGGSASPSQQIPERPQPEEISEQVLLDCGSLSPGVEYIVGGGFKQLGVETLEEEIADNTTTTLTAEQKLASDSLVGELCNRPDLVANMSRAYDPTITLVAYGCDASLGKIGDAALQDSLGPLGQFYCQPAADVIAYEADFLIESAQSFKTETIPELQQELESSGNSTAVLQNAGPILDASVESANAAKEQLSSGSIYDAALSLDKAYKIYARLIESEEMSALLGLTEEEETEE
jgi:hypothetical protein